MRKLSHTEVLQEAHSNSVDSSAPNLTYTNVSSLTVVLAVMNTAASLDLCPHMSLKELFSNTTLTLTAVENLHQVNWPL